MLFTITYTGENALDLGYLLHKNPSRPQTADFSFGRAHVFYPEVDEDRCTAALLLDMDPIDLARGKGASRGLFDYVNDRPYVSSSFMSTAISRVYGTAMSGRCDKKQALADSALALSTSLVMLPCRGSTAMLERVFAPLGYETGWEEFPLDERFPEWGAGRYVNLTLRGNTRLRDLLRQIYVLIPVFDFRKHYWISEAEIDKLLSHGEGWLEQHPEKNFITRRYFSRAQRYTRMALDRLDNGEGGAADNGEESVEAVDDIAVEEEPGSETAVDETARKDNESPDVKHARLNDLRLAAVLRELKESGAKSVIDMGCGEGNLLRLLVREKRFERLVGVDVSPAALERAAVRLRLKDDGGFNHRLTDDKRLNLFQGSLCYRDKRFKGYDAAALVEVIEHIDEARLSALVSVVFGDTAPRMVIVTTPNADYNANYAHIPAGRFRHPDHRFEWDRADFLAWAQTTAVRYGYEIRVEEIGQPDAEKGSPAQMAVFTKKVNGAAHEN